MNNLEQSIKEHFEQASKNADIARAAEKLVKCKGRYHAELNYKALAELFGVTVPNVELDSRWIKCSERMPDEGTYLCFKSGNIDVCTIICGNWIINSFGDTNISHWMPLPPPPTE